MEFIVAFMAKMKEVKKLKEYAIDLSIMRRLTKSQLTELGTLNPYMTLTKSYWKELYFKTFGHTQSQVNQMRENPLEHRAILLKIFKWTEQLPKSLQAFRIQIHVALLSNGLQIPIYDRGLFNAYLKQPYNRYS